MTRAEAEALRVKWKQQADLPTCEHSNQELKASERGYLTGNYHSTDCGEPLARSSNRATSLQVPVPSAARFLPPGYSPAHSAMRPQSSVKTLPPLPGFAHGLQQTNVKEKKEV